MHVSFLLPLFRPLTLLALPMALLVTCLFNGCGLKPEPNAASKLTTPPATSTSLIGIQSVGADNVLTLLPQAETQPVLLAFKTQFCHDCQAMTPTLEQLKAHNPAVSVLLIDVQKDKATYGPIIEAFSPSTVPMVVPVAMGGQVLSSHPGKLEPPELLAILKTIQPNATL